MSDYSDLSLAAQANFNKMIRGWIIFALLVISTLTILCMVGCPMYGVYEARKEGEGLLAHAQSSKEVAVATAKAKYEAADYEAKADVRRAEGAALANKIIGDSLKNNEAYLRYLWIQNLEHAEAKGTQVIYVPTEAGLPILEANRLKVQDTRK